MCYSRPIIFTARSKSKDNGTSGAETRDAAIHLRERVSAVAPVLTLHVTSPMKQEMAPESSEMIRSAVDSFGRYGNCARVRRHLKRRDSCKDENGYWPIPQVIYDNTNCRENNLLPPLSWRYGKLVHTITNFSHWETSTPYITPIF